MAWWPKVANPGWGRPIATEKLSPPPCEAHHPLHRFGSMETMTMLAQVDAYERCRQEVVWLIGVRDVTGRMERMSELEFDETCEVAEALGLTLLGVDLLLAGFGTVPKTQFIVAGPSQVNASDEHPPKILHRLTTKLEAYFGTRSEWTLEIDSLRTRERQLTGWLFLAYDDFISSVEALLERWHDARDLVFHYRLDVLGRSGDSDIGHYALDVSRGGRLLVSVELGHLMQSGDSPVLLLPRPDGMRLAASIVRVDSDMDRDIRAEVLLVGRDVSALVDRVASAIEWMVEME